MKTNVLETKNVNFTYKGSSDGISDLNIAVPQGSIYGFLGPNGSGKTTTIRLILGLIRSKSGTISFFNNVFKENRISSLRRIGALIENPSLYTHLSAYENLQIILRYRGKSTEKDRIVEILRMVGLEEAAFNQVKTYSLGMKQRLGIAIALLDEPKLLILDEPTNGLDPKGIVDIRKLIIDLNKNKGITIFISSHLLTEIEKTCTHVGIISKNGEMLFQGPLDSLRKKRDEQYQIDIETGQNLKTIALLEAIQYAPKVKDADTVSVMVKSKSDISGIIDCLRKSNIPIYQLVNQNSMESLFLQLTDKK
ncbi:ABC transporter ATP-binding protein [Flagellimonas crocea]|uniref:ABC transporter ATP-binding protein n=1 Tax=Flagellimonas crocea TaxID=3067311 RepID=UPI00296F9188|nr:ABC transporter ATP-binding protein [Muricauda sp. DH64]